MRKGISVHNRYELREIAKSIYSVCYDVEIGIVGNKKEDAIAWARTNSLRHAHTIAAILYYIETNGLSRVRILNASGLASGHQDLSIAGFLRKNIDISLEWVAIESPASPYHGGLIFQEHMRREGIEIKLMDFTKDFDRWDFQESKYDVIIFTEIAEHLDHTTLLHALSFIRGIMANNGILILTTPNLVHLANRVRFLFGIGSSGYFGDGITNLEAGLYGHVAQYDIGMIGRLLKDVGFKIDWWSTPTFGYGPTEFTVATKLVSALSCLIPNSGREIFLIASVTEPSRIPFQI